MLRITSKSFNDVVMIQNVLEEDREVCPVHTIVGHAKPHEDEAMCVVVLRREGEELFPGIGKARFEEYNPAIHDDKTEDQWLQEGVLFIGVGGHMFDDHPHNAHPEDCAFTLVLKYLGLRYNLAYQELAKKVFMADRHAVGETFHLASLLKNFNYFDGTPQEVFAIVDTLMYRGYIPAQIKFHEALDYIKERGDLIPVYNPCIGRDLLLFAIESCGNPQIAKAARSRLGHQADLVIVRNPELDHVYISTNFAKGLRDLSGLAAGIRELELMEEVEDVSERLDIDGMSAGWYLQQEASIILRGSLSHVHQPGTDLPHEVIVKSAISFLQNCQVDRRKRERYDQQDERKRVVPKPEKVKEPMGIGAQIVAEVAKLNEILGI